MSKIAFIAKRAKYEEHYALIVPNVAAGKLRRYTVYRIPSHPCAGPYQGVQIVGRELPLSHAKRVAARITS